MAWRRDDHRASHTISADVWVLIAVYRPTRRLRAWAAVIPMPPSNVVPSAVMQCEVCQTTVADELDSYEVLVREVRRRNVPTTVLHVCKLCALAIEHGIARRVEALRPAPREA